MCTVSKFRENRGASWVPSYENLEVRAEIVGPRGPGPIQFPPCIMYINKHQSHGHVLLAELNTSNTCNVTSNNH